MNYIKNKLKAYIPSGFMEATNKLGGLYIAGGSLSSLATNREINDIDCYFPSKVALVEAIRYMRDDLGAWCTFISDKSISWSVETEMGRVAFQFIYYGFYSSAHEIFNEFDFTICMAAYESISDSIVSDENFLLHNSQRHLEFNQNTKFPIISGLRVKKYEDRGYSISRRNFLKIMLAINEVKMNSWEDFRNQCGNLYGLNYLNDEDIPDAPFSVDAAFDVISKVSLAKTLPNTQYKIDPKTIDLVLSGEQVEICKVGSKIIFKENYGDKSALIECVQSGAVPSKKVSIKECFGPFLYKWVREDLTSFYDKDFQYTIGIEAIPRGKIYGRESPALFCFKKEDVGRSQYARQNNAKLLKCAYEEEDVIDFKHCKIILKKVVPVEIVEVAKESLKG